LTKEEFQEWWYLPQTREVLGMMAVERQESAQKLIDGQTLSEDVGLTAQMTARAVGEVAAFDWFLEKRFLDDE